MKTIPWREYTVESWEPVRSGLTAGDSFRDHVGREMKTLSGRKGILTYDQIKRWAVREREAGRLPGDQTLRQRRVQKFKEDNPEIGMRGRTRRIRGKWALLTPEVRSWLVWLAAAKPPKWGFLIDEKTWPTTSGRRVRISHRSVENMVERYGPGGDAAFRSPEEMKLDPYLRGLG